jgi:hypothetical protein
MWREVCGSIFARGPSGRGLVSEDAVVDYSKMHCGIRSEKCSSPRTLRPPRRLLCTKEPRNVSGEPSRDLIPPKCSPVHEAKAEHYALVNVEADRITNSLNMLAEQVTEWVRPERGG